MAAAQQTKVTDRQGIAKKLTLVLKKRYKDTVPKRERPVLETMLFGACLEDSTVAQAEAGYQKLLDSFHGLNVTGAGGLNHRKGQRLHAFVVIHSRLTSLRH